MEPSKRCHSKRCCHVSSRKPLLSRSMGCFLGVVLAGSWFQSLQNHIYLVVICYFINHATHLGNIFLSKVHGFDAHEI